MQSSQKLRLSGGESVWFPKFRRRVTYNRVISMLHKRAGIPPMVRERGEIADRLSAARAAPVRSAQRDPLGEY